MSFWHSVTLVKFLMTAECSVSNQMLSNYDFTCNFGST